MQFGNPKSFYTMRTEVYRRKPKFIQNVVRLTDELIEDPSPFVKMGWFLQAHKTGMHFIWAEWKDETVEGGKRECCFERGTLIYQDDSGQIWTISPEEYEPVKEIKR